MKEFQSTRERSSASPAPTCAMESLSAFAGDLHARGILRQLVAAVVVGVRRVSLGPLPLPFVPRCLLVQLMPQILIRHRLLAAGTPAVHLPFVDPIGNAIL